MGHPLSSLNGENDDDIANALPAGPVSGNNLEGWMRNTSWKWVSGLLIASLLWGLVLPGLLYDQNYDPADMVCGESDGDVPQPWCDSNHFDVWWQSVLHVTDGAKGVAMFSHILNFAIAPIFVAVVICRILGVGVAITDCGTSTSEGKLEMASPSPDPSPRTVPWCSVNHVKLWMIVASAQMFMLGPNSLAKMAAKRQRPCFHYGREENTEAYDSPSEQFRSFYSGDSSIGCCFIAVGLYLLWIYLQRSTTTTTTTTTTATSTSSSSSSLLPLSFSFQTALYVGLLIEPLGAVLRTVADMHWATDVLTGIVIGAGQGVFWVLAWHTPIKTAAPPGEQDGGMTRPLI